jgi:hypothetical protein
VIAGDTPAVRDLGDAVLRVPPGDADALAALLRQLATDQEMLTMARRRARRAAPAFTPAAVTAALEERLRRMPSGAVAPPPLTFNAWLRWDLIARELERLAARDVLEIGPGEAARTPASSSPIGRGPSPSSGWPPRARPAGCSPRWTTWRPTSSSTSSARSRSSSTSSRTLPHWRRGRPACGPAAR